ncbi:complement factor H-like isoform X2 [Aquarana catesbeiana]|uniref:complement factor H-like isoform X2 n=1 Tax=Aquarana catesbeiana TaxID=8400 RepID=UPI003CC9A29F
MSTLWSYLVITICLLCQLMPVDANSPEEEVQCRRPYITANEHISEYKEYYNKGEEITLRCIDGYYTSTNTTRCDNPGTPQEWTPHIALCVVQCRRPYITANEHISEYKEYYNKGEEITLRCIDGYYTSTNTTRCDNPGTPQEWTPHIALCVALCEKPEDGRLMMDPEKTYYNIGDTVTVTCPVGFSPSYPSAQCVNYGLYIRWNNRLHCNALCEKPEDRRLMMDPEKTYYNIGDTVTVTCPVGFSPSYPSAQCVNYGLYIRWNNRLHCNALCEKPQTGRVMMDPEKTYYNIGDTVTLKCPVGYYPSHPSAQCVNYGFYNSWNNTIQCRDLCRKPDYKMMELDPEKTFYNIGDTVTVKCPVGYYPSHPSAQCVKTGIYIQWDDILHCNALCRKPEDTMMKMDPEKTFYEIGDTVTVKCPVESRNSYPSVQCVNGLYSTEWNNPPECKRYCKKPTLGNVSSFYVNKRNYNKGEWIAVQCLPGYLPSSKTMRCDNPGSSREWTPPTITCIALCKQPTIDNVDPHFMNKGYYNKGDTITIRCNVGYYATSSSMRCDNPQASLEWIPSTVTCIKVTFTDWKVTSISVSFQFSCTPQCPDTWRFTVQLCPKADYYLDHNLCKDLYGKGGTFTDLKPSSRYIIQTELHTELGQFNLVNKVIWTDDSVTSQPEILKVPSMEDNTIRWRLSEEWGEITGFQMNISAWRDYNVSFAVDESLQFPPNVTEYKIPLQYGTNYTITLRGLTTSGAKEVTTENIETDIGDPPLHMEKTIHDDILQLYPVPNLNGPIRSYEIIVFGGQEDNSTKECRTFKSPPCNFSWSPSRYTAAVLPAENLTEPRTFILGDNHHYNGFHNVPLIPKYNYTIYIRVTSRWKHVETSSCAFAGVIEGVTSSSLIPVLSQSSLGIIIGLLVLILLALVCLIVVQFTPWTRQKLLREKKRGKAENNISIQNSNYQETCENQTGAEDKI